MQTFQIKFELSPKESQPMLTLEKLTKNDEKFKGGIGISLSRAKSFRAVFAAFLWHEGKAQYNKLPIEITTFSGQF